MPYSATAAAGGDGVSVDITVSTLPANVSSSITAVHAYGTYTVRATLPTAATGTVTVKDRYAPFGVPITYQVRAKDAGGTTVQTDTAPFTLTGSGNSVLTDTGLGTSIAVVVQDQPARRWRGRSVFYDVIGRRTPIVATQAARLMEGSLTIRCTDLNSRNQVRDMLLLGYPLNLRTPYPNAVEDVTFLPIDWQDNKMSPAGGPYTWEVNYQAVSVETTPYIVNAVTYAALAVDVRVPTYASMTSVWATYALLAAG